ncbi:MAG: hypothetical protein JSV50_03850 [Desulfobacteraceae bacterium]|nr:MAG: hypothetical protein JSV50_03850 [Desulfobacteraceae bacterium]
MKIALKIQKRIKLHLGTFVFIAVLVCLMPMKGNAYIMPAEQLISLMTRNFSQFKTLIITQSTHLITPEDLEVQMVLEEKIWLKSPGFHYSELGDLPDDWSANAYGLTAARSSTDNTFRRLFMASDKNTIMALSSEMGINLGSVSLTRYDGVIAYRLGDKDPKAPKLLIEKERFLPLLLSYWLWGDSGRKTVTVLFGDYRQVAEGWYPYEIAMFSGEELEERYFITDLLVNTPIESSFFDEHEEPSRHARESEQDKKPPEEGRLRGVIEFLKDKYKHTNSSMSGHKAIED